MPCILREHFSASPGADGRLPVDFLAEGFSDGVSQPAGTSPPHPQPIPGNAQDLLRGNQSRDQPRSQHHLDAAGYAGAGHIREAWIGNSWIVEVMATGSPDGEPFSDTRFFLTCLRPKPVALPQLVRGRHEPATHRRLPISACRPAATRPRHDIKAMLALGGLSAGTA